MATTRAWMVLGLLVLFVWILAPGATAHENQRVGDEVVVVPAGEQHEVLVELHYHRLVGHVQAVSGEGEVVVRVAGAWSDDEDGRVVAGPGRDFLVNRLVPCCKGTVWAPHTVVLENPGEADVEVDYDLVLLHDGFAVTAEDAEPGAIATSVVTVGGVSVFFAYRLWRVPAVRADPWRKAAAAAAGHVGMWMVAGGFGLYGMLRYGGDPVSGAIAAGADLPWIRNPILTSQDLVLLAGFVLWAVSVGLWTAAARRAPQDPRIGWIGVVMGGLILVAFLSWGVAYQAVLAPVLIGATSAGLLVVGGLRVIIRGPRGSKAGSGQGG